VITHFKISQLESGIMRIRAFYEWLLSGLGIAAPIV